MTRGCGRIFQTPDVEKWQGLAKTVMKILLHKL
jgi:hypothetical protein